MLLVWWGCRKQVERFTLSDSTPSVQTQSGSTPQYYFQVYNLENPTISCNSAWDTGNFIVNVIDIKSHQSQTSSVNNMSAIKTASGLNNIIKQKHTSAIKTASGLINIIKQKHTTNWISNKVWIGLPLKEQYSSSSLTSQIIQVPHYVKSDTMNSSFVYIQITPNTLPTIKDGLQKILLNSPNSIYDSGVALNFTCNDPSSMSSTVIPTGKCGHITEPLKCQSPCKWQPSSDTSAKQCVCDCEHFQMSESQCVECDNCYYHQPTQQCKTYSPPGTDVLTTNGSMFPASSTVTLGDSPNTLNQDLSESPSTSLTTYPSYSPPSQQPQQMTTPAARDYYNYGYSNGYSSGYYASLYSRYPYYGYNYNNNYNNYNNNYNNGYAYGGGDTVSA